jgi:antitoxin component of MazEF toxin-antitoxin module
MAFTRKLKPIGNSYGVILPQPIIQMFSWDADTELQLQVEGQKLILSPVGLSDKTTEEPKKRRPPKS